MEKKIEVRRIAVSCAGKGTEQRWQYLVLPKVHPVQQPWSNTTFRTRREAEAAGSKQ